MDAQRGSSALPGTWATRAVDSARIGQIQRRVLSVAGPDRIIRFGSAAAGRMAGEGDVDLLAVERAAEDERRSSPN